MILKPVILKIDKEVKKLKGAKFTRKLSELARVALVLSGEESGIKVPLPLPQKEDGTPLEFNNIYWSISHKPDFVMGCVSPVPFGLDIEAIKLRSKDILDYVVNEKEWDLDKKNKHDWQLFYRFWTAKESVLKAEKIGIAGLSNCRVEKIINEKELEVIYKKNDEKRIWHIKQKIIDEHIFAITCDKNDEIQWIFKKNLDDIKKI